VNTIDSAVPLRRSTLLLLLAAIFLISGCTGTFSTTQPVTVQMNLTIANVVTGHTEQFTVTVTNTTNTVVTWQVNGVAGGNSIVGTITASGLYTAPTAVPSPATVTVTAIAQADPTKSASATVMIAAPPLVAVAVSPKTANVVTAATQQFTATVSNTSNTAVTWQVNGVNGGNSTVGTISASGLYTAPAAVPSPASVTIKAVSQADNTKSDTATVTVTAPLAVTVTVNPKTVNIATSLTQQFTATVANTSNTAVTWQVNGVTGGNSTVGTISASGLYTAPAAVPSPASVTVKAISQADNTKSDTATVTVILPVSVTVSPKTVNVQSGFTQQFLATVANASNTAVTWQVNGVTGGNSTVGTISTSGLYTAPAVVPSPASVTVKAISQADNTKSDTATVTITPAVTVTVTVSPKTVSVVILLTQQFTATVANTSNTAVTWQVNGVTGGNSTVGTISASGLYTAPAAVPSPAAVTVKAISQADNTKSDTATVTVVPPVSVTVSPKTISVQLTLTQQFTATVANASNTAVTWQVNGVTGGNSTVGTISASGLYTAPSSLPSPAQVTVKAISQADNTKSDTATVTLTLSVTVTVSPKTPSVQVGLTQQFTATVANNSNTAVTWQVNGVTGGNSTVGTISASGLYTAPATVPATNPVTVKAISQADNTKSDTATVTITPAVTVTVSPKTVSVVILLTQQFTATVANTSNTAVTWQVNGVTGGNSTVGTISASGLYTAPAAVPSPAAVTVKAISQADNTKSDTATVTVVPPVSVTVSPKTPSVAINLTQQFVATVLNTSNTAVTWQVNGVTGGNSTTGTINTNGLYTAPAAIPASNPVTVTAISQADNTKSDSATVTITPAASITVTVSPKRAAITTGQTQTFTPTVSDSTTVTWEVDTVPGGNGTVGTISSAGVYTPPATGGVHNIVARSVENPSVTSAASTIAVTDLAGVFTYHNDNSRDGVNTKEYGLTTSTVTPATFGKLFSCNMDGAVYAQPLWIANFTINGAKHNLILAVSMRDTVYLFDADANPCVMYWSKSMLPAGETFVGNGDIGSSDIYPDIGILGTPVIDPSSNAVYLVAKSKTTSGTLTYHQRLHALNLADGSERTNSPVDLTTAITFPGNADAGDADCPNTGGGSPSVPFCAFRLNQRGGLALANGTVYVVWASHGDNQPYHGWVLGFNASTLARTASFNTSPNGRQGGIWMSGGAPALDSSNNLFLITGNGDYDGVTEFGDTLLKLSPSTLAVSDWFTPAGQAGLDGSDLDFGSGGAVVLVDVPTAPHPHMLIGGGKGSSFNGELYVLDRDNLGHLVANDPQIIQKIVVGQGIFATEAYWQNTIYVAGAGTSLQAYSLNTTTGLFNTSTVPQSPTSFLFPGTTPSVSSSGSTNGVVWAIEINNYGTFDQGTRAATPAVLHAYDANNIATEVWNSSLSSADTAGNAVKFTVPTIANGKVYVPTRGDDTTINAPTNRGRIDVYGLKPN
jgi:hypothetical protein